MAGRVGGRGELARVAAVLSAATSGHGSLVLVLGEPGSGKARLAQEVAAVARRRAVRVIWGACEPASSAPACWPWIQCLRQLGDPGEQMATRLLAEVSAADRQPVLYDAVTRILTAEPRTTLLIVEDLHLADDASRRLLAFLARRLPYSHLAVVATTEPAAGNGDGLLAGSAKVISLPGPDHIETLLRLGKQQIEQGSSTAGRAIIDEALELARGSQDPERLAEIVLRVPSRADFLDVDVALVRLLEDCLDAIAPDDAPRRARLLARLSMELLGDRSADERRCALADDALMMARKSGDPGCVALVLHARQHALWEPGKAAERLTGGAEIVELARRAGDIDNEIEGRFWRFIALMEVGRIAEAEAELAAYARLAEALDRDDLRMLARSRQATMALLRGRFDDGVRLAEEARELGRRAGVADTERVFQTLMSFVHSERDPAGLEPVVDTVLAIAQRSPRQYFESDAAMMLAALGRDAEADAELKRVLPQVLDGTGARWLFAAATLVFTAARLGDANTCGVLLEALLPYADLMVMPPGAVTCWGSMSHCLGLAATGAGRLDDAVAFLEDAIPRHQAIGALPWLARSQAALAAALDRRGRPGDSGRAARYAADATATARVLGMTVLAGQLQRTRPPEEEIWALEMDGTDWVLRAGSERARMRDIRGLHYLVALLSQPRHDVRALDLVAGGPGLAGTDAGPVLDRRAKTAYRRRLAELDAEVDAADRAGDPRRAERAIGERQALVTELRRAAGLAGRDRHIMPESERARVNVTRTLRLAIDRIAVAAPLAGAHLRASIRTGSYCRYEPSPGGPASWRL